MRYYQCRCGNVLYFENSRCVQCGSQVGYEDKSDRMLVLDEKEPFQRCKNGIDHAVCNWVVAKDCADPMCTACRLNRTIPALDAPGNREGWHKLEIAKRRVLYTLARMGLSPLSMKEDPVNGLAFDFLLPGPSGTVLTGHEDGVITVNVEEAEDAELERRRGALGERFRTLVGHFRHEMAHYYWDRYFKDKPDDDPRLMGFREVFGDDRQDYQAALASHYADGAPPEQPEKYISAYAAVHPWEDWAETWAHYLHITDGAETCEAFGLKATRVPIPYTPFPDEAVALPAGLEWQGEKAEFLALLQAWSKLAPAINEIVASLGHHAFYPFVFSVEIVRKLSFIHYMVHASPIGETSMPTPSR